MVGRLLRSIRAFLQRCTSNPTAWERWHEERAAKLLRKANRHVVKAEAWARVAKLNGY